MILWVLLQFVLPQLTPYLVVLDKLTCCVASLRIGPGAYLIFFWCVTGQFRCKWCLKLRQCMYVCMHIWAKTYSLGKYFQFLLQSVSIQIYFQCFAETKSSQRSRMAQTSEIVWRETERGTYDYFIYVVTRLNSTKYLWHASFCDKNVC